MTVFVLLLIFFIKTIYRIEKIVLCEILTSCRVIIVRYSSGYSYKKGKPLLKIVYTNFKQWFILLVYISTYLCAKKKLKSMTPVKHGHP